MGKAITMFHNEGNDPIGEMPVVVHDIVGEVVRHLLSMSLLAHAGLLPDELAQLAMEIGGESLGNDIDRH